MASRLSVVVALIISLFAFSASAQEGDGIPAPLKMWESWVLADLPDLFCPEVQNRRTCEWPGTLQIDASKTGATFTLIGYLDRDGTLPLPGGKGIWPQEVTANGASALVGKSGENPTAILKKGAYRVSGKFVWKKIPEVVPVPRTVGRVELSVAGADVTFPRIDEQGRLFLKEGAATLKESDSIRVTTFRRLTDGVPFSVQNRFELKVSGRAREVTLGSVLFPNAIPTAVTADLPTRTDGDVVRIFVRPGKHTVTIDTVLAEMPTTLTAPKVDEALFDKQEVWVWQPNDPLQSVELEGLTAIDPERTSLPDDWRNQTTFLADPGTTLNFKVTRRGVTETAPNAINLARELWLDLDGNGYTVRDRVNGTMRRDWRLNYQPVDGAVLGRVTRGDEGLLITTDPATNTSGVEIRGSNIDLTSEIRLEEVRNEFHIVGWDHDVQSLSGRLHLPPGWSVFHGQGIDRIENTWMSSWTLWDLFFIFMIVLGFFYLFGFKWAGVAFVTLLLTHGHASAPEWSWIHLIVSLALLRVLPEGIWYRIVVVYRAIAFIVFAVILAMYANDQVMSGLFPQVGQQYYDGTVQSPMGGEQMQTEDRFMALDEAPEAVEKELMDDLDGRMLSRSKSEYDKKDSWGGKGRKMKAPQSAITLQQIDPNAVVQTGPGVPDWQWNTWNLEWTGPVRKDQTVSFWLIPAWMNRVLSFARIFLLFLLMFVILALKDMSWSGGRPKKSAVVALVGLIFCFAPPLSAQEPVQTQNLQNIEGLIGTSDSMLDQLRNRIVKRSDCPDPCVVVSKAEIKVDGARFTMTADLHAAKDSGMQLPGPIELIALDTIELDGLSTDQLRREPGGLTTVRLPKGSHRLRIGGTLAGRDVVTVQLDENVRAEFVTFESKEWTVDGLSDLGVADSSLQLTRVTRSDDKNEEQSAELPPWFLVQRHFAIGLPWQVETTVTRRDNTRPQLVKFPLLKGERVITEGFRVEENEVLVELARGVGSVTFVSEISIRPSIELTAHKSQPWTERWSVECSRIWRCEFDGVPVFSHTQNNAFRPLFYPWPGETLQVDINRPEGVQGSSSTVTRVDYEATPGKRLLLATLRLQVRASQGGWQKITIPPDAELQSVSIDNVAASIRPVEGLVSVPLKPGAQNIELRWQQPWERKMFESAPTVDIGSEAVNARMTIFRGDDRWVLWGTGGAASSGPLHPSWGPAVLFWPRLIIMLLLAIALGRIRRLPIKTYQWMLLVIGLSQLPPPALLPIVFWFLLMRWRREKPLVQASLFDLLQIAIPFFALVTLATLYAAIHTNLLIDIDMQVEGAGSTNTAFKWYVDQTASTLPQPTIVTVSHWFWRLAMLVWSVWLVRCLFQWVPWSWSAFSTEHLWKPLSKPKPKPTPNPEPQTEPIAPTPDGSVGEEE